MPFRKRLRSLAYQLHPALFRDFLDSNVSEFDISITKTPFGKTSDLRNEVKSILHEVVEMERLTVAH